MIEMPGSFACGTRGQDKGNGERKGGMEERGRLRKGGILREDDDGRKEKRGKRGEQGAGITNECSLLFSQLLFSVPSGALYTRPGTLGMLNGPPPCHTHTHTHSVRRVNEHT